MIASIQNLNTEISAFIAVLVLENSKFYRWIAAKLLVEMQNFQGTFEKRKQLFVSSFQFAWLYL